MGNLASFLPTAYFDSIDLLYASVDKQAVNNTGILLSLLSRGALLLFMVVPLCQLLVAMIIRVVVMWVLLVISPLAWIGFAIPEARGSIWTKYWA